MSKIIKAASPRQVEKYHIKEFSSVKRGESVYDMEHFSVDSVSVQDEAQDPSSKLKDLNSFVGNSGGSSKPEPSRLFSSYEEDAIDTPSAPRLFSSYEEGEDHTEAPGPRLFSAYEPDEKEKAAAAKRPSEKKGSDGFQEVSYEQASHEASSKMPDSQKEIAEKNAEISGLEKELHELKEKIESVSKERDDLQVALQKQTESIPELKTAAHAEGYEAAKTELENQNKAHYEAEQKDYLDKMDKNWQETIKEVKKINDTLSELDKDMPEIVMSYVRQLVGAERKLNDEIIINVVKNALSHLKDIQQIIFTVNPDDAKIIAEKFPQYGVSIDAAIPKGSVKVRTKIGEINLSIDSWMDSLEHQINEQLAISKNDQTN